MSQVNAKIEKIGGQDHLIITMPIHSPVLTESEKSYRVCTAQWIKTDVKVEGKPVTFNGMAIISARA